MIFEKGDKVIVNLPEDIGIPLKMFDYNGKEFKVSKTSKSKSQDAGYCHLEGAVSNLGVDFCFLNTWLTKA